MREPAGASEPPISSIARPWVGSLSELLQPWVSALNEMSAVAQKNLQLCNQSLTTFQNNCKALTGDMTLSFQGLGARAFENLATLNEGHSMEVNAKIHDFYNASNNLTGEIQSLTNQYELGNMRYENDGGSLFPNPVIYQFVGSLSYDDILRKLMEGFLSTTSVDALLDPGRIYATITAGTQVGLNQMTTMIDEAFQGYLNPLKRALTADPGNKSYWQGRIDELTQEYHTSLEIVQGLTTNMNNELGKWGLALNGLAMQYAQEIADAAKIDQPTVADFLYESTLPPYAHQNVLIWQLPAGGLFIMVKGGDPGADEQIIKNYLARYGQPGSPPRVTIMGYQDGISTAQKIIEDSQDPSSFLSIQVINAIMAGNQDKQSFEPVPGINYVDYSFAPEDKKAWSLLGLNEEQVVTMGVTTLVALALDQEELLGGDITTVLGKLGTEKLAEYATALGFNASDAGGETPAQYLIDWATKHNQEQIELPDKSWVPMQVYVQQQLSRGSSTPLALNGLNHRFDYTYTLPNEDNLNQDLNNSAYLGSQFVLDPVAMSKVKDGVVTLPPMTNLPPSNGE